MWEKTKIPNFYGGGFFGMFWLKSKNVLAIFFAMELLNFRWKIKCISRTAGASYKTSNQKTPCPWQNTFWWKVSAKSKLGAPVVHNTDPGIAADSSDQIAFTRKVRKLLVSQARRACLLVPSGLKQDVDFVWWTKILCQALNSSMRT